MKTNPKYHVSPRVFQSLGFALCLAVLSALFSLNIQAQSPSADTRLVWLKADDGLPSSRVNCLLEDSSGFLWLGTSSGLSRYDGRHILSYGIRAGLPHIRIRELQQDVDGRIWVLSEGRLAALEQNRFVSAEISADPPEPVLHIGRDEQGQLLASTSGQLFRYVEGSFRPVLPPAGTSWLKPQPLFSSKRRAWLYDQDESNGRLISLQGNQSQAFQLRYPPADLSRFLAVEDQRGRIIYLSEAGLVLFHPETREQTLISNGHLSDDPSRYRALLLDNNKRLWLAGASEGVQCWLWPSSLSPDSLQLMPVKGIAPGRQVEVLLQDREGNIWLGTGEDGAAFLPGNASFVRNLTTALGLSDPVVLSMATEGSQNVWMGMRGGQVQVLNFAGIGGLGSPVMGRAGNSPVQCLMEAPDGSMLAGSEDGLFMSRYRLLERHGPLLGIQALAADSDSSIYVGTSERLYRFDPQSFEALAQIEDVSGIDRRHIIADRPALRIAARPQGGCWYANEQGLFQFDGFETSRLTLPEGLLAATISDLAAVAGCLAISTRGEGLLLINESGLNWPIDALTGLPGNICSDLFVQDSSTLWVATNRGIARLQIHDVGSRSMNYETYDTKDGLLSNEINTLVALRGSLYLGTNTGISIFNEADFRTQSVAPGIYLMGLAIAERDTLVLDAYELPYSQNRLAVRFSGIAFSSGNLIHYRYRMSGLDEDWNHSSNGEVRYGALPPGQYRFEVQAINKDGVISEYSAGFDLRIRRPWYQTGWFLFLAGLGIAGISFAGYNVLIGQHERKLLQRSVSAKTEELDRKIQELRRSNDELEQFAYIASHDLKEPLRNIANYVQLLEKRLNGQLDNDAHQYMGFAVGGVKRMYDMIDGLLIYSGLTRPDPSVALVNLNEVLEAVIADRSLMNRERQVVVTKGSLPVVMVNREQIRELFTQLIDNAIKFNESNSVRINLSCTELGDELQIAIEDNGIGLEDHYQEKVFQIFEQLDNSGRLSGSGIGLALCKKIVERHGGRIWYESRPSGTVFYFTLKKNLQNQIR